MEGISESLEEVESVTERLESSSAPGSIFAMGYGMQPTFQNALLCDGRTYSPQTYPDLYNAIGYSYGGQIYTSTLINFDTLPVGLSNVLNRAVDMITGDIYQIRYVGVYLYFARYTSAGELLNYSPITHYTWSGSTSFYPEIKVAANGRIMIGYRPSSSSEANLIYSNDFGQTFIMINDSGCPYYYGWCSDFVITYRNNYSGGSVNYCDFYIVHNAGLLTNNLGVHDGGGYGVFASGYGNYVYFNPAGNGSNIPVSIIYINNNGTSMFYDQIGLVPNINGISAMREVSRYYASVNGVDYTFYSTGVFKRTANKSATWQYTKNNLFLTWDDMRGRVEFANVHIRGKLAERTYIGSVNGSLYNNVNGSKYEQFATNVIFYFGKQVVLIPFADNDYTVSYADNSKLLIWNGSYICNILTDFHPYLPNPEYEMLDYYIRV